MIYPRALLLALVVLVMPWGFGVSDELISCNETRIQCFAEPCSVAPADFCKTGQKCQACGCTAVCAPAGAKLQYPLQKCDDGTLAVTCGTLSSLTPGSKCAVVDCQPGYICKEYLCGSSCQAQCVLGSGVPGPEEPAEPQYECPDGTSTKRCDPPPGADSCGIPCNKRRDTVCGHFMCGSPPTCGPVCAREVTWKPDPTPPPTLPPMRYKCPDGSAASKCEPPDGTDDCPMMCDTEADTVCGHFICGKSAKCSPVCAKRTAPVMPPPLPPDTPYNCPDGQPAYKCDLPRNSNMTCEDLQCITLAGVLCGHFLCGSNGTCAAVCVKDPFYQEPEPSPYVCPDNSTQALMCSTGTDYWTQCGDCQNKEGFICSEFQCGKNAACSVMCLPDPYYRPYLCPNNQPGKKCEPPVDQRPECKCTELGTFCAALECNGVCNYTCVQDPWFELPESSCPATTPLSGKPGTPCKEAAVTTGQTCSTVGQQCDEGFMCSHLDCGAGCSAYCVADPYYYPPQPSSYLCPADNSTALMCTSYKDMLGIWECAAMTCEDGEYCGNFKCGSNPCKAMCVRDPWYRPYICPGTQDVAKWCELPPQKPITCPDCAAKGPGYFCGSFTCGGDCAPVCMQDPWYEPAPYICNNGVSAQQCPGDSSSECAAMSCPEGQLCGNYDCSGTPNPIRLPPEKCSAPRPDGTVRCARSARTKGGALLMGGGGRLVQAGSTTSATPTKPTRLGSTGTPQMASTGLAKLNASNCKVQCVLNPLWPPASPYTCSDGSVANECGPMATQPVCSPQCSVAGTFCMNTACGTSSTCSPQCVTDPYYQPPPLICPSNSRFATTCDAKPTLADCAALNCAEQGMTCAVTKCSEDDSCETRCLFEGYIFPWRPPVYTCGDADSTIAVSCEYVPKPGEATCADVTCPSGMYCSDMECPDADGVLVCSPKCLPYPPPSMGPPGDGGGAPDLPCPGGKKPVQPCTDDPCDKSNCTTGTSCVVDRCDCTAQCVKRYKGPPVVVGPVEDAVRGGVKKCVQGQAVDPKTCTADNNPCKDRKCDNKTQTCVAEYCGGCRAACLSKKRCKQGNERRACIGDADFCKAAKCKQGATCIPDQCNNCLAKCVGPCEPGKHASRMHARCIQCPKGHACAGNVPGPMTAAPKACNSGFFADESTKPIVECTKCPDGMTTPDTPGVGYTECKAKP